MKLLSSAVLCLLLSFSVEAGEPHHLMTWQEVRSLTTAWPDWRLGLTEGAIILPSEFDHDDTGHFTFRPVLAVRAIDVAGKHVASATKANTTFDDGNEAALAGTTHESPEDIDEHVTLKVCHPKQTDQPADTSPEQCELESALAKAEKGDSLTGSHCELRFQ